MNNRYLRSRSASENYTASSNISLAIACTSLNMRSALGHTVAKDFKQPMPSRISSLVTLVLVVANSYLQAAINEMIVFISIHTTKGVCILGAIG